MLQYEHRLRGNDAKEMGLLIPLMAVAAAIAAMAELRMQDGHF